MTIILRLVLTGQRDLVDELAVPAEEAHRLAWLEQRRDAQLLVGIDRDGVGNTTGDLLAFRTEASDLRAVPHPEIAGAINAAADPSKGLDGWRKRRWRGG